MGGLRIKVAGDVYDGSVRARLAGARGTLLTSRDGTPWLIWSRKSKPSINEARRPRSAGSVGIIREIGDGVARIEGLDDVMLNEMLDFGGGITGLALNLDETEVAAIVLGDYTKLREGDEVRATGKLLQVPVGKGAPRTRRQHARRAARRQGPDRERRPATRSRSWRPASSGAGRSASRCRPESWRSTR